MTAAPIYDVALAAHDAGLSIVPPAEDGTKRPLTEWRIYQRQRPTTGKLAAWYADGRHSGLGFVCGEVSGNLECLEFDDRATLDAFLSAADRCGLGDLIGRIRSGYEEETPGGGAHWLYRCDKIAGNTKLARRPKHPEEMRDEHDRVKVLIETRGRGGYVIVAPSDGRVHPTGKSYRLVRGGVDTIAILVLGEREELLSLARSFDQMPRSPASEPAPQPGSAAGTRPGDDFNARAAWSDILELHGWRLVFERGGEGYWRRPGKDRGVSATTNHGGAGFLYVFTSSTDFEPERGYSKFSAYALLEHGGDFEAAARALAAKGFGESGRDSTPVPPTIEELGAQRPAIRGSTPAWPPPLTAAALYGLAGDIVRTIEPHTEADPVAILATTLVMVGNAAGRSPHVMVGDDRHGANLFVALVGDTSKARKGTSQAAPRRLLGQADPAWTAERILGGLSTGEGLLWAIRDRIVRTNRKGEEEVVDEGVADKRVLCVEEEFSSTLKVGQRQGNTVSETIRRAWDSRGVIATMTKNSPARATDPHISILAHISREELLRTLTDTETANGFGNRFIWLAVRRSKALPFPQRLPDDAVSGLGRRIQLAIEHGRKTAEFRFTPDAARVWIELYPELSNGHAGLFGALTARAEAQVIRLALIYAMLDLAPAIGANHLTAALAFWDYAAASARFVFGDATGDPIADRILSALRSSGALSQSEISDLFGRNVGAGRLAQALETLVAAGRVVGTREEARDGQGGRPRTLWSAR